MPETPEQLYARAVNDLRMPPVKEWETFPFDGEIHPRTLQPPTDQETPRQGIAGVDCRACDTPDADYLWTTERWRLKPSNRPSGLPIIVILEPRAHFGDPGDLPDDLGAELGRLLARIDRAIRSIGNIGRVHVCRWGDGGEHLHWWFMGRPARLPQLIGSFAAIWDDILPPTPEAIWHDNLAAMVRALDR